MNAPTAAEIATRFGLRRIARGYRGTCPSCGYPQALSVLPGRNGGAIVACFGGCEGQRPNLECTAIPAPPAPDAKAKKQQAALKLWSGGVPVPGTPAAVYLASRGLDALTASPVLRFRADTPHPNGPPRLPALLALVQDMNGQPIALHRTFIRKDGAGKAPIEPPKASLGPLWGGAIRLSPHDLGKPLVIGEGIETAASAGLLMGYPAWAAISAGNLATGLILPPCVRHVIIATDPDPPGERAAQKAAERWLREGRRIQFARPKGAGDFNDLLRNGGQHG